MYRADVLLSGNDWGSYVVGKLDPSIDVDSRLPYIRRLGETKLTEELKYATHLGLPAVLVRHRARIKLFSKVVLYHLSPTLSILTIDHA